MERDDYDLVTNGVDCNTRTKIINIALAHNRDSVQLHMGPRDEPTISATRS
jgi:hypothetical protein